MSYNEAEQERGRFPWPDGEESEQQELRRMRAKLEGPDDPHDRNTDGSTTGGDDATT